MKRKLALAIVLAVVLWVAGCVAAFVLHHDDEPIHADAVVVLQGSDTRLPVGYRLVQEGYAPLLVISRGSTHALEPQLCDQETTLQVVCFSATSTTEEAEFIRRLARERDLERLDVVTSHFHVFRARLVFSRCFDGELRMVGSENPRWRLPWVIATESAKLTYQLTFARDC
jgi:uncharacterized SAM-binding protein YcdF (DUF218 family)